jgi:Ca-activated chloride channel family protein
VRDKNRPIWNYGLFQKPLIGLVIALVAALVCYFVPIGQEQGAMVIALDISSSTYSNSSGQGGGLSAPDTVSGEALKAVDAYIDRNSTLKPPRRIKILAFGDLVVDLTEKTGFTDNANQLKEALARTTQQEFPLNVPQRVIPSNSDIDTVMTRGLEELKQSGAKCGRELLVITDGRRPYVFSPDKFLTAALENTRVNFVLVGSPDSSQPAEWAKFQDLAKNSGGLYSALNQPSELTNSLLDRFLPKVKANWSWIVVCLGLAWIALMWTLVLPIDRFLQKILGWRFDLAGRAAIGYALFWTAATPGIVWRILEVLKLPFLNRC